MYIQGYPYRQRKDLAEELGISLAVAYSRTREIEQEIGQRYGSYAVIHDGNLVLVNILVFIDWMCYRRRLQDKNMRKYVPQFSAVKVAEQMGWDMHTSLRDFPQEMAKGAVV